MNDTLAIFTRSKLNCEVLHDNLAFEVRWAVAGDSVVLQLVAKLDDGEYMAFGLSGDPAKSVMIGGDVVVAWVDKTTLKGSAVDYYLDAKSQCSGSRGSCPDNRIKDNSNSVRLLNAALVNGYSIVTYQRPLAARDSLDKPVFTNGTQPVIWAVGPLNQRGEVSYHSLANRDDILLDFGRAPKWNCPLPDGGHGSDDQDREPARPAQTAVTTRPPATPAPHPTTGAWEIPPIQCHEPEDGVFYAQMGPTGGKHGYPAITGHVGWGISWYINGLLIPEINVVRGKTYTFVVEGGLDSETPARYHPFYITDDPVGGYEHKTPQERASVRIFAGAEQDKRGKITPTGTGRLCNWTPDPNQPLADEFASFGAYQRTLTLVCDEGEPGVVQWTPDNNTPDTVYYQCFTHRYLGWKINVLDSCDSAPRAAAASEPVPAQVPAPQAPKEVEESADGDLDGKASIQVETRVKPYAQLNLFGTKDISEEDKSLILTGIEKLAAHAKDSFQPEKVAAQAGLEGLGLDPTTLSILQEAKQKELELAQAQAHAQTQSQIQHHFRAGSPGHSLAPHGLPNGLPNGFPNGFPNGLSNGFPNGLPNGLPHGLPHGLSQGFSQGLSHGLQSGVHVKYRPMLYKMPPRPMMRPVRPMYLPQSPRPLPPGMLLQKQSYMTALQAQALPAHNYVVKKKPLFRLPAGMPGMVPSTTLRSVPMYGMLSTLRPLPVPVPISGPSQAALAAALYGSITAPPVTAPSTAALTTTTPTPPKPTMSSAFLNSVAPLETAAPFFSSHYRPLVQHQSLMTGFDSFEQLPRQPPPVAVNTGFNPGSVVVEGGFKPILQRRQDVAEDRMAFVEGEDDEELMEGSVVEMEKRSSDVIDREEEEEEDDEEGQGEQPQDARPTQTETFEPMFIPSPPDRNSLKPGGKKATEPGKPKPGSKLIVRPRPAIVRRPLYPNMVLPPFKIPTRGHSPAFRNNKQPDESDQDETMMAAERMDTYYLPPVGHEHVAVVTYDGKAVDADVAASIPLPPGDAIHSPNTADLVRGTPQFGPFLGEAPPPVPVAPSPQDLPQLHAPRHTIQALPLQAVRDDAPLSEASEPNAHQDAPSSSPSSQTEPQPLHRERRSPHHEPGHEGHEDTTGSAPSGTASPTVSIGLVISTLCAIAFRLRLA